MGAKSYEVRRTINAPPGAIWPILTNAAAYPDWNESVTKIEGSIEQGATIKVFAKVSPGRAFPVKVAELTPPDGIGTPGRMVWQGGMPLGLFKGVRVFTLTPKGDGETEFYMREDFTGLMSGLICKSMPDLTESFNQFADGLKQATENRANTA